MLTPNETERISMAFDAPMRNLENRIMEDIIRRIKINGEITRAADWQINRLYELGMSRKDIENAIKQGLDLSDEDIHKMYSEVLKTDYLRNAELYKATGKNQIPFDENFALQRMLNAISDQTYGTLKNITNSLGFSVRNSAGKLEFKPIADYYQQTLDAAMLDIASGAFDYNTVLKRTVNEMTNSGLRTVDYASGWANRVDVAARRAIMTGMSQLTAKVNESNAKQLGTEYYEVTWHGGARPEHQVWQGKVYSRGDLEKICGLGTVTGLCGANCYHDYYPFIPGISERTYTDEQLAEMNREENTPVEYNGRKYTKYEALQRQRRLETAMRAKRQLIRLLESGGADEDDIINARCRYHGLSQEYSMFSKAMELPQQRDRVTIDGLGNIGQGKYTGGSGKPSPVNVPPVGAKVTDKVTDSERLELLRKNAVDFSGKSGIIESGSDDVILENQRYGRNKTTLVNKSYIESGEYRRKYDNATDNQEVNKTLYDCAKAALKHRSGTVFEDMYWIDSETGKVVLSVIDSTDERAIIYTDKIKNTIKNNKNIITLHTHPSSMPPSISDLNSCCKNKYKIGFIACHDGRVFAYTSKQEISENLYNIYIGDFICNGNDELNAQLLALNELKKNHEIDVWEVK